MPKTQFLVKKIVIFGKEFSYHLDILLFTIVVCFAVFFLCLWLKKKTSFFPTKRQIILESLLEWFDNILKESNLKSRFFLSFIVSLFLFILISNCISVIPKFLSPTRDLNTCLGLALVVSVIAHINAIKTKGIKRYIKGYFSPYWWLFPSNVFSEISKTLSHSFRLFGNIFAGGIVISLVPTLILKLFKLWGILLVIFSLPILKGFFDLFVGGIQAFVFTILAVAYIGVLSQE
ncbi:MAG TPA: F0F1 ATP synthase subunit A [Candidatus Omnitrophica bacterium]|nr:F0F1 ATP synthase subunit A [Candidatus Omnitrophota bacterium]